MKRVTLTVPDEIVSELDFLSMHLMCSRSALTSLLLSDNLSSLSGNLESLKNTSTSHIAYKRASGDSLDEISDRYREFLDEFDERT